MPEYLSPGVYVEETSFRSKSIEGVSTTTTGFVGPCRYGPLDLESDIVTSLVEFERVYGDGGDLGFHVGLATPPGSSLNYLWHAVRAFFAEGGKRLYVARTFARFDNSDLLPGEEDKPTYYLGPDDDLKPGGVSTSPYPDGHARHVVELTTKRTLVIRARYPGAYGNFRVRVHAVLGQNILVTLTKPDRSTENVIQGALADHDVVTVIRKNGSTNRSVGRYHAQRDPVTTAWKFTPDLDLTQLLANEFEMRVVTLTVTASPLSDPGREDVWSGLTPDARRSTGGQPDGLTHRLGYDSANPSPNRGIPIVVRALDVSALDVSALDTSKATELIDGLHVLSLFSTSEEPADISDTAAAAAAVAAARFKMFLDTGKVSEGTPVTSASVREYTLDGGNDGSRPAAAHYEGAVNPTTDRCTGLVQFEGIEDISIVAAPGSTAGVNEDNDALAVSLALINHCRRMRYRIAVLDPRNGRSIAEVRAYRSRIDSSHAALYYPWVRVVDPNTRVPIHLPPSGFVAGIYARNDTERAVYKAPANEVVNMAIGFEVLLNKSQQDVLNPEGINCFRFFEGRGYRLWGARTTSSDPEWKYVNVRRYFAYLERSIERGTQWAVFEPNGEALWGNVRRTIEDFLFNEFASGALLGEKPDKAYFVKCDRSTMTQNDLDNGRLICLIGVAALRPAEFVIFRIGQWTGDRKV